MLPHRSVLVSVLLVMLLPACGSSSSGQGFAKVDEGGSEEAAAGDADVEGGAGDDAAQGEDSSAPLPDATMPVDSGSGGDDAGAEASVCVGLGASCKDTSTCLCGAPSGCIWDNVACTAGVCTVTQSVPLDAGEDCCSACQAAYDDCTPQGPSCLSQWVTCNAACGACPVVCAAGM